MARAPVASPRTIEPPAPSLIAQLAAVALVLAAGLFAWRDVPTYGFKFDDNAAILQNVALQAGNWWDAALAPPHQPLANRPFTCWTLTTSFLLHGDRTVALHLGNLLCHLLNGVLVLWLAVGSLRAPNLRGTFTPAAALRFGLAIALVWVVHPLCTDSIAYATQRSTLVASGCLLVALLAALRAHGSARAAAWRTLAVLAMCLGMAAKEDLVAGPLLVLLHQRAFVLPDWRSLRAQAGFLCGLALAWLVLAACLALGPSNRTVGFATSQGVTAWQWLMTQAGVVAHYVRLAAWPDVLRGAYADAVVEDLAAALLPGAFVLALLALTVACWVRSARLVWLGWLGALFFLWLAPTSSVMPIVTEIVAERRMYLPMLFVIVPVMAGVRWVLVRYAGGTAPAAGAVLTLAATVVLAVLAQQHAAAYATEIAFWQDAHAKRDTSSRGPLAAQILTNQGTMLLNAGRVEESHALFDQAMECRHVNHADRTCWAASLHHRGRTPEAIAALEQAMREAPEYADAPGVLGTCLLVELDRTSASPSDPRYARAIEMLRKSVQLAPRRLVYWNALGSGLVRMQRGEEALAAYQQAVALPFERIHPYLSLDDLLRKLGRGSEADAMWENLLRERPRELEAHLFLASRAMDLQDWPAAQYRLRTALAIAPDRRDVQEALREVEAKLRR